MRISHHSYGMGRSMHPTLRTGDLLRVEPYGGRAVRVGDVLLFYPPGDTQAVAHRAVSVTSRGIRTRGDHHPEPDPWILSRSDITGRVVSAHRETPFRRRAGRCQRQQANCECGESHRVYLTGMRVGRTSAFRRNSSREGTAAL